MKNRCFTIGHRESYLKALEEGRKSGDPAKKLGKSEDYEGGYAFKNNNDAWSYIKSGYIEEDFRASGRAIDRNDFSVFVIKADWDKDTYHIEGRKHNNLNKDCQILWETGKSFISAKQSVEEELLDECENGCLTYVEELVEAGADPKFRGSYALQSAAKNGHLEVVKYLVEECGCDINKNLPAKEALSLGHLHVAKYLVSKGASLGKTFSMTLLAYADDETLGFLYGGEYINDEEMEQALKAREVIRDHKLGYIDADRDVE